ncbi:hypothetical protein [Halostagnicola sp. A-GB9-2]|uniref:hypothetical protein n=1 Tax=Halostagnicola sp. A-GB9-2 TaxID=3048066 RepID=UPI0024C04275|nr:hypothetical protein [Halostagnicola sp. A-GB9-2]MDJ1433557.1 hypothetical protein [Halostagnicola sp. A-GB9-2]
MNVQTSDITSANEAVQSHPVVQDARVVDDHAGFETFEIVLLEHVDRVPPAVLRQLGTHDCGIKAATPQGDHLFVEVK